jgi:deazaflavin-dependent oxidoreductase (nitroreductase family)
MTATKPSTPFIWRLMRQLNPFAMRNFRRRRGPSGALLLLTTTGRKSGLPRQTPLQYELIDGDYYVGSARGEQADWLRNLQVNPRVQVETTSGQFPAIAEAVTDPARIADFFQVRLQRHPFSLGLLMRLEGLPWRYNRRDLERFAAQKAMAILRPEK